jgi:deoxyribonuclease-4
MAAKMRVRQILNSLDTTGKAALKKLLPTGLAIPECETQRYPNALLSCFPKEQSYSLLGLVAEDLLALPAGDITVEATCAAVQKWHPACVPAALDLVRGSKTTQPFLEALVATRQKMEAVLTGGAIRREEVVAWNSVEGHPDFRTDTQVFEVKLTGLLKQNWTAFLFQLFAYAALASEVGEVYLVLPLQRTVWKADVRSWAGRVAYRDFLDLAAKRAMQVGMEDALVGALLREMFFIGFHAPKSKTLLDTVRRLGNYAKPYQIFLGGPQNSKVAVTDGDLAATAAFVGASGAKIYVHSQYIINLCNRSKDDWHTALLKRNLQVTSAMGGRGVVVHVGKSVGAPLAEALEAMRGALMTCLEAATPECPILLETPAGQGTETLKGMDEFIGFVESFGDPRLRVCLDTCHVFACGHKPKDYITRLLERPGGLLKLIHYNDSAAPCGSCVDRHAMMGTGHIGMDGMREIAELCAGAGLPMVIE